ncbi:hypothetical protein HYALB_00000815 [Hymenoscyphus albidus]|uniref:Peptidase A1 domain-containing protein n=1 Tax=Hymenoscyphus albidus TaxID=595503 RepID=A0A9N9LAZ4_9HELO|nr:hypothetical protein HYALB_00000815 [Hymenoscyphus albidus]
MWIALLSLFVMIAGLSRNVLAVVILDIARGPRPESSAEITEPDLKSRALITSTLYSNLTRGSYYIEIDVGTPPQPQRLFLDTGSSDVWLLDSAADLCLDPRLQRIHLGGCGTTYTSSKSSTYKLQAQNQFNISYLDRSGATGDYISDTIEISGSLIPNVQMGFAHKSTIGSGLMGIGYSVNQASQSRKNVAPPFTYPSVIERMVSARVINRKAYSLYLSDQDASTGSIIFGGMDTDKFHGDLFQLPVVPNRYPNGTSIYAELAVVMSSFSITEQEGNTTNLTSSNFKLPVLLDSGTTFSYLPRTLARTIYRAVNALDDTEDSGLVFIDCAILTQSPKLTFNYGFGGANGTQIQVPIDELVFSLNTVLNITEEDLPATPFPSTCAFGILPSSPSEPSILGDTFLRSAYVVYDLDSNVVGLAQTNFNSTSSRIVEFRADATKLPEASQITSSPDVTQTANTGGSAGVGPKTDGGGNGIVAGSASASNTVAPPAGSTIDTFSGVAMVPAREFYVRTLVSLGIAGSFAILGGGWFVF